MCQSNAAEHRRTSSPRLLPSARRRPCSTSPGSSSSSRPRTSASIAFWTVALERGRPCATAMPTGFGLIGFAANANDCVLRRCSRRRPASRRSRRRRWPVFSAAAASVSFGNVTILIAFLPCFSSFLDCGVEESLFVVPTSTATRLARRASARSLILLRIALLHHQRLADAEVVDERDLLPALGRVVHAADDRVALLREQRGDDAVEAGVLELRLHAEPLRDCGADVDVGAGGLRCPGRTPPADS